MTVSHTLREISHALTGVSDAPALDARRIMLHVLGKADTTWLIAHGDEALSHDQQSRIQSLARTRATGVPLAYILGYQEFYGRRFFVNRSVLVPRPSTEMLVDHALALIEAIRPASSPLRIADVGTGSGCIAITMLHELLAKPTRDVHVIATDASSAAIDVAIHNAREHGVSDRITFVQNNILETVDVNLLDLVISNPPYVPTIELDHALHATNDIERRGLSYEPRSALDGGTDGLSFVRQLLALPVPAVVESIGGEVVANRSIHKEVRI